MLIGEESEELVLEDWPANRTANEIAMKLWNLFVLRNIAVLIEEERGCVQPVGAASEVGAAVISVGPGLRAHVNMRTGGRSLLSVVHRRIHSNFLKGLRRRGRNGV